MQAGPGQSDTPWLVLFNLQSHDYLLQGCCECVQAAVGNLLFEGVKGKQNIFAQSQFGSGVLFGNVHSQDCKCSMKWAELFDF